MEDTDPVEVVIEGQGGGAAAVEDDAAAVLTALCTKVTLVVPIEADLQDCFTRILRYRGASRFPVSWVRMVRWLTVGHCAGGE